MSLFGTANDFGKDNWEDTYNFMLENAPGSLYSMFERNSTGVEGRNVYVKVKIGTSLGQGNILESGDFPTPGDSSWDEVRTDLYEIAHTIELSNREWSMLNSSTAAAAAIMEEKMTDAQQVMQRDIIRQTWGDGTARLARVSSATATTFTLASSDGSAGSANQVDRDRFLWLEESRMRISTAVGTTGASEVANLLITDINESTNVVTISGSSVAAADSTYVIYRTGNAYATGGVYTSKEFPGILAAINATNTYLTLNRSTAGFRFWKAQVVAGDTAGTNQALTTARLRKLMFAVHRKAGAAPTQGNGYCWFSNIPVLNAYGELAMTPVRYTNDSPLDLGYPSLQFDGMMWYGDHHAPRNNAFLLKTKGNGSFEYRKPKYQRGGPFKFFDMTGSIWSLKPGTAAGTYAAAVQARLLGMLTFVTTDPNKHGRLDDIIEVGV